MPRLSSHYSCKRSSAVADVTNAFWTHALDELVQFQRQHGCPIDLHKWQTEQRHSTQEYGMPKLPRTRMSKRYVTTSGVTSKQQNAPQTNVARSPRVLVSISHWPRPHLFSIFNYRPTIWHSGPRPRAHWYMCTDGNHHNYSPLI